MELPMLPLPSLPPRKATGHKGDYGRALLVGGSRGMSGAISLAGMAALRSGTGLVSLAVPESCMDVVAGHDPSYMTIALPSDGQGRIHSAVSTQVLELAKSVNCLAVGPGLSRSAGLVRFVAELYRLYQGPMVLDADALNALASNPDVLRYPGGPRILTPHPGEFRRMINAGSSDFSIDELRRRAFELAGNCRIVIVLKGHRTLVTDGQRKTYNTTGNPGMATGGSGDVLTGVVTAMVCQGLPPFEAAQLAVYVHGLAGDLAADALGQVSLIATDLVKWLPAAFRQLDAHPTRADQS